MQIALIDGTGENGMNQTVLTVGLQSNIWIARTMRAGKIAPERDERRRPVLFRPQR
jgi:hypothetical protein